MPSSPRLARFKAFWFVASASFSINLKGTFRYGIGNPRSCTILSACQWSIPDGDLVAKARRGQMFQGT